MKLRQIAPIFMSLSNQFFTSKSQTFEMLENGIVLSLSFAKYLFLAQVGFLEGFAQQTTYFVARVF